VFKTPKSKDEHSIAMSTASDSKFTPGPSHGDYWNGYMVDATLYKIFAMFPLTGFLGIDHLVLRSPFTAILKFLINVLFFGAWYFYDIIQMTMDQTFVAKYGMSTPWGPRGHSYKLFSGLTENNVGEFANASIYNGGFLSSLLFLVYVFLIVTLGFTGLPNILAGDFAGGITKLFSNWLFIPFVFYLLSIPYDFVKSMSVEKTGVPRNWPLYPWLILKETHPAMNLLPKEEGASQLKTYTTSLDEMVKEKKQPLLVEIASATVSKIWEALTNFPPVAAFTSVQAAKGGILAASDVGQSLAKAVQKRVSSNPDAVIDSLLGKATEGIPSVPTIPAVPDATAATAAMKGGAMLVSSEFDKLFVGGVGVLVLGGVVLGLLRKFALSNRREDDEHPRNIGERDDAPPRPAAV